MQFDFYFGAHMTQNECVSTINSPGAALVAGANAPASTRTGAMYGACPIFNGSTAVPWIQKNLLATPPRLYDMDDVDDQYDAALAGFVRRAVATKKRWFFYFASHHTHVPQFSGVDRTGYTLRGLQGDSLSLLDRSVGRLLDLVKDLGIDQETLVIFSADNGGARYWGPDVGGVNGELACEFAPPFDLALLAGRRCGGARMPTPTLCRFTNANPAVLPFCQREPCRFANANPAVLPCSVPPRVQAASSPRGRVVTASRQWCGGRRWCGRGR